MVLRSTGEALDPIELYRRMSRVRAFELAVADLWLEGRISGEMHLGTGEEAVAVGVVSQLREGDAVALDHRSTPVLLLRGSDPVSMLREMLGRGDGLCGGRGGHMHLMDPERLAASSGIVGASGPLGAGFALAARQLRRGAVAVSFFGEGALNQGMLMESLNLAAAWKLPQLFVCKDNSWAITTRSSAMTGGDPVARARGFGLRVESADGLDVRAVEKIAGRSVDGIRRGKGPVFLHLPCSRLDGHFLGDPVVETVSHPTAPKSRESLRKTVAAAVQSGGASASARARGLLRMMSTMRRVRQDRRDSSRDPLVVSGRRLRRRSREAVHRDAADEVAGWVTQAVGEP